MKTLGQHTGPIEFLQANKITTVLIFLSFVFTSTSPFLQFCLSSCGASIGSTSVLRFLV